ncbi:MAG: BtpA/SgcQ family protein [Nanoarchaeota archaeon]
MPADLIDNHTDNLTDNLTKTPLDLTEIFKVEKPIIGLVHVSCTDDLKQQQEKALQDVERLKRGGIDGLLFENWGGDYHDRHAGIAVWESLKTIMLETAPQTKLPYGLNVLPLDYEKAFSLGKITRAHFVQVDTLADKVRTDYQNKFVLDINARAFLRSRRQAGFEYVPLLVNIQTKHYSIIPWNKKLETSAQQAIGAGADILIVTGKSTGRKTPKEKLRRVKRVSGATPVFIGSGLDEYHAEELLSYADGAIVGTSLKYGGVTENPVEEERVKRLMEIVYRVRDRKSKG